MYEFENGDKIKIFKTTSIRTGLKSFYIEGFLIRDNLFKIPIYYCIANKVHLELKLIRNFKYKYIVARKNIDFLKPLNNILGNDSIASYDNNDTRYNDLNYMQDTINYGCYILKNIFSLLGKNFYFNWTLAIFLKKSMLAYKIMYNNINNFFNGYQNNKLTYYYFTNFIRIFSYI